jgi:hypothetical protein
VDYEFLTEHPSTVYPYGLVNVASEYIVRITHLFVNPAERDHVSNLLELPEIDYPTPVVNMVDIRQIGGDSLSTILEESTRSTSSTHAITNPYEFPAFPPSFGGAIFAISADEPSHEGETNQERAARMERNTDCTAHRVE